MLNRNVVLHFSNLYVKKIRAMVILLDGCFKYLVRMDCKTIFFSRVSFKCAQHILINHVLKESWSVRSISIKEIFPSTCQERKFKVGNLLNWANVLFEQLRTACPRSLDPFHIASFYEKKWGKTSKKTYSRCFYDSNCMSDDIYLGWNWIRSFKKLGSGSNLIRVW